MDAPRNGARLGVMATGLGGEYCFAVVLSRPGFPTSHKKGRPLAKPLASVRIDRGRGSAPQSCQLGARPRELGLSADSQLQRVAADADGE